MVAGSQPINVTCRIRQMIPETGRPMVKKVSQGSRNAMTSLKVRASLIGLIAMLQPTEEDTHHAGHQFSSELSPSSMIEEEPSTSKVMGSPPVGCRVTRMGRRCHLAGWQTGMKWSA